MQRIPAGPTTGREAPTSSRPPYYVLALNLFFGEAYEEVMHQLVNGLGSGELAP
jgi:hypothetical protein